MPASIRDAKRSRSGSDIVIGLSVHIVPIALRIVVDFIFLWTSLDKTFGLGSSAPRRMAWINGGQPVQGFVEGVAVHSPFGNTLELSASPVSDWLFMAGMLGAGTALTLGIGPKMSAFVVSTLMVPLYLALWSIGTGGTENAATNPLIDFHWALTLSAILFALTWAGDTSGLGTQWFRLVGDSWLC